MKTDFEILVRMCKDLLTKKPINFFWEDYEFNCHILNQMKLRITTKKQSLTNAEVIDVLNNLHVVLYGDNNGWWSSKHVKWINY